MESEWHSRIEFWNEMKRVRWACCQQQQQLNFDRTSEGCKLHISGKQWEHGKFYVLLCRPLLLNLIRRKLTINQMIWISEISHCIRPTRAFLRDLSSFCVKNIMCFVHVWTWKLNTFVKQRISPLWLTYVDMLCCAVVYISFLAPDFIVCFRQFCQWRVRDMSNSSQRENPLRHEFAICCECGTSLASFGFRSRISINFIFIRLIWFCKSHSIIIERNDEKNLLENPNTWNVNGVKCFRLQNTQVYNMVNLCGFSEKKEKIRTKKKFPFSKLIAACMWSLRKNVPSIWCRGRQSFRYHSIIYWIRAQCVINRPRKCCLLYECC